MLFVLVGSLCLVLDVYVNHLFIFVERICGMFDWNLIFCEENYLFYDAYHWGSMDRYGICDIFCKV